MKKLSLIKVVGVLAICLMTFLNSQSSIVLSEDQESLDLNKLVSMTQANAESDAFFMGIGCIGWGVRCSSYFRPEQKEVWY